MKKPFISLIMLILFGVIFSNIALSWDDKTTHKYLSQYAAENSVLSKNKGDYLKNLGFVDALDTSIKWSEEKSITKWLQEGAELEDAGNLLQLATKQSRSYNHFHDPTKQYPWTDAGLDDWIFLPPFHTTGESSLLWAQDGANQEKFPEKDWSWMKVRDYYYLALTSSVDSDRQEYFARTFRGLGHQMHLLQDTSVPDHVRNDAHPEDAMFGKISFTGNVFFESWAKNNQSIVNSFAANPIFPNVPFNVSYGDLAPITQLFDAEVYKRTNPSATLSQGLAEYTNANFFSNDTLFAVERYSDGYRHYFPYPKKSSTDIANFIAGTKPPEIYINDDGIEDIAVWISKIADGENIAHFVRPSFMTKAAYALFGEGNIYYSTFYRDEKCHEDYASKLIPRAVGYSVGLLNYFFRGNIEMIPDETGSGYVIVNNTGEKMEGDFTIYYDSVKDERFPVWAGRGTLEATKGDKTNTFNFIHPNDAKEFGKYIVVFKGKMGNEDGAVVGGVTGRFIEITPPDQFVYSMVDANQPDPYFTSIKAKVRNASTSEAIQNGVIQAVTKYKTDIDDEDYIYSMSAPQTISLLASDQATEFEFNFSNDPIPVDVTDLYLQVIFKGTIGNENNAVAIGLKDISEPTPIDVFNNMDRICINGQWYVTGTQEAYDALPANAKWWDYWPHDLGNEYIKISPADDPSDASPTNFTFYWPLIKAGTLSRMFILSDYKFAYSGYGTMVPTDPNDNATHDNAIKKVTVLGSAVRNQEEYTSDPAVCSEYGLNAPCIVHVCRYFIPSGEWRCGGPEA
jgi:hypothetical protein